MPSPTKELALEAVEAARARFSRALRQYRAQYGQYIDIAPPLPQSKVAGCRVFGDRHEMLSSPLFSPGQVWAEIGVDQGLFSKEILTRVKPAKLHLIDLQLSRLNSSNVVAGIAANVVQLHEADSAQQLTTFPDGYFDVVYIDGDHYYEGVKRDIAAAHPKLKPHALLVFNDYASWSPGYMYKCGVAKAVNEFINAHNCQVVAFALQGSGYHDIAVRIG
jgi:hypothetical protein